MRPHSAIGNPGNKNGDNDRTKTGNSQIIAGGPLRVRVLTVLAAKNVSLVFRPYNPVICRALVCRAIPFAQEFHADGPGSGGARTGVFIRESENSGGELYEKKKEGG